MASIDKASKLNSLILLEEAKLYFEFRLI